MPKIVNHDDYREELLDRSFEHFARKGYEITLRELARELNVSTGTLYHYFPSKKEIFKQMMSYISHKQVRILVERLKRTKNTDEKVKNMFHYILANEKFFQNIIFLIIDYYRQNECKDPDLIIKELSEFYRESISEQLQISDSVIASTFLSFTLGIIIHRILNPSAQDWDEQISFLRSMLLLFPSTSHDLKVA
ncbi:MAG: TetR/AcrR family transcriptional regulator [Leptospiraceae bacterium]|nr:TetR/AcrR family transcriptional regulator [Leptospiraceae bacterium]